MRAAMRTAAGLCLHWPASALSMARLAGLPPRDRCARPSMGRPPGAAGGAGAPFAASRPAPARWARRRGGRRARAPAPWRLRRARLGHPAEQAPHIEAGGGLVLQQRQDGGLCLPLPSGTALARGATSNAANIDSHNRHYGKYCRGRPFLKALGRAATQGCSPQAACAAITTRGRQRRHQLVPWAPPAGSEPMGGPRRRYFSGFS